MVIQPSASFSYWTVGERKKNMPALIRESCSTKIRYQTFSDPWVERNAKLQFSDLDLGTRLILD